MTTTSCQVRRIWVVPVRTTLQVLPEIGLHLCLEWCTGHVAGCERRQRRRAIRRRRRRHALCQTTNQARGTRREFAMRQEPRASETPASVTKRSIEGVWTSCHGHTTVGRVVTGTPRCATLWAPAGPEGLTSSVHATVGKIDALKRPVPVQPPPPPRVCIRSGCALQYIGV